MPVARPNVATYYQVSLRSNDGQQTFDLGLYQCDYETAIARARSKYRFMMRNLTTGTYYVDAVASAGPLPKRPKVVRPQSLELFDDEAKTV
jgi:hypothetical protein